jgi:hypothetical protein
MKLVPLSEEIILGQPCLENTWVTWGIVEVSVSWLGIGIASGYREK